MNVWVVLLALLCGYGHARGAAEPVYPAAEITPYPSAKSGGNYVFNYYLPPAGNSSPWWVSWSSEGSRLFFSLHGSLWKIDANGGAAAEILESADYLSSPTVSPDGRFLAYTTEKNGDSINVRILDIETGRDTALTHGEYVNVDPEWSPDGSRIAYLSNRGGVPGLRILNAFTGADSAVEIAGLEWKSPRSRLTVRTIDAGTAEPVGSRIYNRAADGKSYAPLYEYHRVARRLGEFYFHGQESFELEVPAGEFQLEAHLISPFAIGLDGTAVASLFPSNTDVLQEVREQGALGGYVHPFRGAEDPLDTGLGVAKAFPVDLALGTLGFHELTSQASWASYTVWHHALNAGFRVPVVGGEDAITDLHKMYVLGQLRTYAKLDGKLSWKNWLDAIRGGRTVVTNGPLLTVSVEGADPGTEIDLAAPGKIHVTGTVHSVVPLDNVELVINGETLPHCAKTCDKDPHGFGTKMRFERDVHINQSSWITLQAYTNTPVHPVDDHFVQATTNAVWVNVDDKPIRSVESIQYFRRWVQNLRTRTEERAGWRNSDEKQSVLQQFDTAAHVLDQRLREAEGCTDCSGSCKGDVFDSAGLSQIEKRTRNLVSTGEESVQYGIWLGRTCGGPSYVLNGDVVIPAASAVKPALLIEFFFENAGRLDKVFSQTKTILAHDESAAVRHFEPGAMALVRRELIGLTVRQIGEAMISKKHVSSNAAYNAAANVVIASLGGPELVTQKIRRRHGIGSGLTVSRYMLADRHATGDNTLTLNALATIHRSLAARDVAGVDRVTIEAARDVMEIDAGSHHRHFYKGGSLSSDPQVRIEAGWLRHIDGEALIYVVAGTRLQQAADRGPHFESLRVSVAELSAAVRSLWLELRDR